MALTILLLAACSDILSNAPATAPEVSATEGLPSDYPSAAGAVLGFLQAINKQDYRSAFSLLDDSSRHTLKDADSLQTAYTRARDTATATQVMYSLRGGMLQQGLQAVTTLAGIWQTTLLGTFTTTNVLTLTAQSSTWRVVWSGDLILPGMSNGQLTLRRETPQRGIIFGADGSPLAAQSEGMTLGIRRSEIKDKAEEQAMLSALSQLTGQSTTEIQERYQDLPAEWFVPIADIDVDTLTQNSQLIAPFAAVSARPNYTRSYPQSTVAPHVVGYIGPIPASAQEVYRQRGYSGDEQMGLSGVEGYMDATLAGSPGGSLQVVRDDGSVITIASKPFTPSRDVTLTISPTVQVNAQKILGARRGAIVVMNPRDGSIMAMASYPTYDNAILAQSGRTRERAQLISNPERPLLNRAIQGVYPAGSTFKIVTMAAGMGEGVTSPTDVFVDPGFWDGLGSNYRKTCWLRGGHGRITLQDGLTASCDVVFYNVGKRLDDKGSSLLSDYGRQFGFGTLTGVELTGEAPGVMPDPEWKKNNTGGVWTPGDTVNLSIGQGFMLATPLQVAQMTAAVASGGTLYRPHVVASIAGRETVPSQVVGAEVIRKLPISDQGLASIQRGLAGVTTNARIGTTTFRFSDFDYYINNGQIVPGKALTSKQRSTATKFVVAGKSGTAQAPGAQDKPFAWFTAYAPADNPQVVVTVLLENIGEGSVFAAPLTRQMIEAYFGLPISPTPHDVQVTD